MFMAVLAGCWADLLFLNYKLKRHLFSQKKGSPKQGCQ
jgi:hypothetical protein